MATLLYRLGKTAYRRWPLFIAGWLVALIAVGTVAGALLQADDRRLLDPGHPVGEGRRPAGRALPRLRRRLRPGHASPSSSPRPRGTRSPSRRTPTGRRRPGRRPRRRCRRWPTDAPLANPVDAADAAAAEQIVDGRRAERHARRRGARRTPQALSPLSEDGRVGTITFDLRRRDRRRRRAGHPGRAHRRDGPAPATPA